MAQIVLSLGSNLGDNFYWMRRMEDEIETICSQTLTKSPLYKTAPVGVGPNHPSYLNRVVKTSFEGSPEELLFELQKIELKLGRHGKGELLPRTTDIDILLFEGVEIATPHLTIPHHALFKRRFEIEGVKAVAGDWVVPKSCFLFRDFVVDGELLAQDMITL